MSLSKQFKTDSEKEQNGVAIAFAPNDDGTVPTFYIARQSSRNTKYARTVEAVTKPYRRQIDTNTLGEKQSQALMMEVFVKSILLGWQNVAKSDISGDTSETGYADFTPDNAKALFERLPELYDSLNEQSKNVALFKDEAMEADAKN